MNKKILIVDDDTDFIDYISSFLQEHGFTSIKANDQNSAIIEMSQNPDLVLLDLIIPKNQSELPNQDRGIELLQWFLDNHPYLPVIMITGKTADLGIVVDAIKMGAYHFIEKKEFLDSERDNRLILTIERALERSDLKMEAQVLNLGLFVGEDKKMKTLYHNIARVAKSNSNVLITGETGTGKQLVAEAIHNISQRKKFLSLNCGALTDTIVESELFGHKKGAFTSANKDKKGIFELAHGGTIFLDEIEAMSPRVQVDLLKAIEDKVISPVGGKSKKIPVDFRLICATNTKLKQLVENKAFRKDLFYRLNVINIDVPPLRDRKEDIRLLAYHFLREISKQNGKEIYGFTKEAIQYLRHQQWEGNVRELKNRIERAIILHTTNSEITKSELDPDMKPTITPIKNPTESIKLNGNSLTEMLNNAKCEIVIRALHKTDGNKTRAAKLLGITRQYIHKIIDQFDIEI